MTTIAIWLKSDSNPLAELWGRLWAASRPLALSAALYATLLPGLLILALSDPRLVTGAPVWFKPIKFTLSGLLYTGTLAWLLGTLPGRRAARLIGAVTALALGAEIGLILMQAGRGVQSHFNGSTPFDDAVWSAMGSLIMVVWTMLLLSVLLALRARSLARPRAWALRLGLLIVFLGGGLSGMLMVRPTAAQTAAMRAGQEVLYAGGHSVGVADGGPGLSFLGWSTAGGDLRAAHFLSLHALQALPLAALVIGRRWGGRLSQARQTALVIIAGLGYAGLVLLALWQA
ncbi:MAG: hypothetical protein ACRDHL_03825, partial [Candidatus Promineifilaceae bacterium]